MVASQSLVRISDVPPTTDKPLPVKLGGQGYYITMADDAWVLASRVCPHQGGIIRWKPEENCFHCPIHNWEFDGRGRGLNTSSGMVTLPLLVRDNGLWIDDSQLGKEPETPEFEPSLTSQGTQPDIDVSLLGHACLQIRHEGLELLIDPWLDGPAMLGAWRQYPLSGVSGADLTPDAIIITHEHSDHFHLPTLRLFKRDTPIFVPGFTNGRIEYFLEREGFSDVHTIKFECPTPVSEKVNLTFFRPTSVFNDSVAFLDIDGFKLLNLNDAGLNREIADWIGPCDLVACIFSTGASGYPLAWSHLDRDEKRDIMRRACEGRLQMLEGAIELYQADRLLPFASHVRLWQPGHRDYFDELITNTIDDVVAHFRKVSLENQLVDLIPGDSWNSKTGAYERAVEDRGPIYDRKKMAKSLEQDFADNGQALSLADYWGIEPIAATESDARNYFEYLNQNPDIVYCEDVNLTFVCYAPDWSEVRFSFDMAIIGNRLRFVDVPEPGLTQFRLEVSSDILGAIMAGNLSWDEARVGYWLRWWRSDNMVHSGFLRLLQGPYGQHLAEHEAIRGGDVAPSMSISSIIEIYGPAAETVLQRYGLHCTGCSLSPWESIADGAAKHGIRDPNALIAELSRLSA